MSARFQINTITHDGAVPPKSRSCERWSITVVGETTDIDERSKAAKDYCEMEALVLQRFRFDAAGNSMHLNGEQASSGKLRTTFRGLESVLIEATSLSFPEILYVTDAALREGVTKIRYLYLEPMNYRREITDSLCNYRDFNLSDNRRFRAIPQFMANLSDILRGRAVFFLGYEGERLGQALEQEEVLRKWNLHAVFGVPAYGVGWENDAMANNIQYLGVGDQVQYAAASSVNAAYNLLSTLRKQEKEDYPILVAPLGTKPHAIGAVLFLIEHNAMDQAVLLYDHPARSQGRSESIKRWHFYDIMDLHPT